jgi:uncharacterized protein (DUF427 family)
MPKAIWKGVVIAESDDTTLLEGDHYFPPDTVKRKYLKDSDKFTDNSWMGKARYYHLIVGDDFNKNAAFYYPEPSKAATAIKDHIAFIKGVEIVTQVSGGQKPVSKSAQSRVSQSKASGGKTVKKPRKKSS